MNVKIVNLYDPNTRIFSGTYEAHESPEEPGEHIEPNNSTGVPLPLLQLFEVAVFDPAQNVWLVEPDFRGQTYYDQAGTPVMIDAIGPVPLNLAATKPASVILAESRDSAIAEINAACAAEIVGGFSSSALGSPHTYTCTLEDQANLLALIAGGAGGNFTCVNAASVKARRPHTDAELRALLADGRTHVELLLGKARDLKDAVAAAADVAAVEAVVW